MLLYLRDKKRQIEKSLEGVGAMVLSSDFSLQKREAHLLVSSHGIAEGE
jgi:hypothetical protein